MSAANFIDNFRNTFTWLADNWKTVLLNMSEISGKTWESIFLTAVEISISGLQILGKQLKDFWAAIKKRDMGSILDALTPLDDIKEQFGDIRKEAQNALDGISNDLELSSFEIKPIIAGAELPELENALDAVEANERQKVKDLAKLEEDLKKQLLEKEKAARKNMSEKETDDALKRKRLISGVDIGDRLLKIGGLLTGEGDETQQIGLMRKQVTVQERIAEYLERLTRNGAAVPRFT